MAYSLDRRIFIAKTKLTVAYSNFTVNMAFGRHPIVESAPKYAALFGSILVAFMLVSVLPRHIPKLPSFDSVRASMQKLARVTLPKPLPTPARIPTQAKNSPKIEAPAKTAVPTPPTAPAPQSVPPPEITASLPSLTVTPPESVEVYPDYAIAVDKSKKILFVLKNKADSYEVLKIYDISLGRKVGMKKSEGDLKTPSGFYQIIDVKSGRDLPDYYGPKAFVTNYPNRFDQASGRGGGGIWIHGSKGRRTLGSHGCVVLDNKNLMNLEAWVGKNTPVAIFPEEFSLPVVDGKVEKKYISAGFFYGDQIKPANRASREGRGSPG